MPPYAVTVAPIANAQIEAALLWWSRNRPASRGLLANEVDRGLALIEHVPQAGRRTTSTLFRDVRRLLLRRSGYHLYYQVLDAQHAVHVVYFVTLADDRSPSRDEPCGQRVANMNCPLGIGLPTDSAVAPPDIGFCYHAATTLTRTSTHEAKVSSVGTSVF